MHSLYVGHGSQMHFARLFAMIVSFSFIKASRSSHQYPAPVQDWYCGAGNPDE